MRDLLRSLTFRLAVLTALWLALGLGASAWYMARLTTRQIEAGFEARLTTVLDAVVALVGFEVRVRVDAQEVDSVQHSTVGAVAPDVPGIDVSDWGAV